MKKISKILVILFLLIPFNVKGANFEIITYNVGATFTTDRRANIEENYNIYFTNNVNKISRIINKKLVTVRPNNTKRITNSIIGDVSVLDKNFNSKTEQNGKIIDILTSVKQDEMEEYNISYSYNLGKDTGVGYDELFFEIVDGNFDAAISSLTFEITLPKEFDKSKIKFAYNSKYDLSEEDVIYDVNGNTITGVFNRMLNPKDKLQLYIELPENYFSGATDNYNYMMFLLLIFPIITLIVGIIYFKKYKYKNKIKIDINEEVPYNFDSAEIAYLYKGYLKEHDLMTLLVYLANKGYIMFEESDDGYKLGKPNSFKIIKLKEYEEDNAIQKILFDKLFQKKDIIEISDIEYNLYDTLVEAKSTLDNKVNRDKLFFKDISKSKLILFIFIIVSTILINAYPIYLSTSAIWAIPILSAVLILGIYIVFVANVNIVVKLIFGIGLIFDIGYVEILPIYNEPKTLIIYTIGMLLIFISSYIYKILPIRTKLGNEYLGKIYGFRKAIDNIPIVELDKRLKDNPNFFYEMYPYMYVLDDLELWNTKCSNLVKSYPSWFVTHEEFSIRNFQKFVKNMIFITTQAMFKRQLEGQSKTHIEYKKDVSMDWIEK